MTGKMVSSKAKQHHSHMQAHSVVEASYVYVHFLYLIVCIAVSLRVFWSRPSDRHGMLYQAWAEEPGQ